MSTRFYLPANAEYTPITPVIDSAWEVLSSIYSYVLCNTFKRGLAITQVDYTTDTSNADQDIAFRGYISLELNPGQTITGAQEIRAQCLWLEPDFLSDLFATYCIRIINGLTVQKVILPVTRDDLEISAADFTNRQFIATSASGNYTTVAGDRVVIELGIGGDPNTAAVHNVHFILGDASAVDAPTNDTSTPAEDDFNPWVQFTDTLTFLTIQPLNYIEEIHNNIEVIAYG